MWPKQMISQHNYPSSGVYRLEIYRKMWLHKVAISLLVGHHKLTTKISSSSSSGITILDGSSSLPQLSSAVLGPVTYVCNSLPLQITVHAGLSLLFPSGFQFQKVLKIQIFYGVGLSASCQTPNLQNQAIPFCLGHHLDLSGMGGPNSSYGTASTALRIIWSCKPHRYFKVWYLQWMNIKVQNSRMCDEVRIISYRNKSVLLLVK